MSDRELPYGVFRRLAQWITLLGPEHVGTCIGLDGDGSGDYCCCHCACCPCWSWRCSTCRWSKPLLRPLYRFAWREEPRG